jgi:undecaprenyl-diphosphatase
LYFRTPYRFEALFSILVTAGNIFNPLIKHIVDRPRPLEPVVRVLEHEMSPSSPSGHAIGAIIFYGFLLYLIYTRSASKHKPFFTFCLVFLVVLVGISRVYLGAHWPSDVVGRYAIGGTARLWNPGLQET